MTKKAYEKPAMSVVQLQHRHHLLAVSGLETSGLKSSSSDPDLNYDNSGGDQGSAW